ncbi:MAG TPA: lysophospholipid acyltransferase family protein [Candidatus Nanopelagicaceae bacterium]
MANLGSELDPVYQPPHGKPLGTNPTWKFSAGILIPLVKLISKRDWRGTQNIPRSGPMIAISNHISYVDPLILTYFLYNNGRAVRFLGKASLFKLPIIGWILRHAEQVPVEREIKGTAAVALPHAIAFLNAGHCLGVYPEGTLTRDEKLWPMRAKTGLARLAVMTKAPVIPCAQWGAQEILEPYSKVPKFWPRTKVTVLAGQPLDFSPWFGKEDDHLAMVQATEYAMAAITSLLEEIRGESAPAEIFDPHLSDLPRTGNYKNQKKRKSK